MLLAAATGWVAVSLNAPPSSGTVPRAPKAHQSLKEGVWGLQGPCPHVDGPQKFLLLTAPLSELGSEGIT